MFLINVIIRKKTITQYIILISVSALLMVGLFFLYRNSPSVSEKFYDFYHKNLRGYLFSGFISVGSFLLSLHTFVIVNLRDKVFATDEYKKSYSEALNISQEDVKECELFRPLNNLSSFINASILLSLITAISQFTLGLSTNLYACLCCVWLAIMTICFLLHCLIIIRENIKVLLKQSSVR
ncbi:TPA: hypothetical protein ACJG76_004810 [Salmonella enterica subsp. diarizonae serovar 61:i:z]